MPALIPSKAARASISPTGAIVGVMERHFLWRLVERLVRGGPFNVLELGAGKGANATFFAERGDTYTGIDLVPRDEGKPGTFLQGDFTRDLPPGPFDLIVERGAFSMCSDEAIARTLALAEDRLVPGGIIIASDLYAAGNVMVGTGFWRAFDMTALRRLWAAFHIREIGVTKTSNGPSFYIVARKHKG